VLVRKIKDYLARHSGATLLEIAGHHCEDKDIAKNILDLLIEQGEVCKSLPHTQCCSDKKGCKTCFIELVEMYYLTDSK
jgi:hypothetical protein